MAPTPFVCAQCARARASALQLHPLSRPILNRRALSRSAPHFLPANHSAQPDTRDDDALSPPTERPVPATEPGAMTSRLRQATEDAIFTGGRAGRRAVEEAGFSDELKARLLDKVAAAKFHQEHSGALAQANITSRIPDSAGLGTRAMASAQPWTGQEATEAVVLRMLDDARKPLAPELRGKSKPPVPGPVDMRLRREVSVSPGHRMSSARDMAQVYAGMGMKEKGLSEEEREAVKREFRERFAPGARAMPNTVTGLAALANERIEDAIARGQFKNIPRGKGIERDTRADNPFIDTTEYIMNKMIKRQDIVPPWIEKQQELIKTAENFRGRLRNDWKRHAARMIASRGGTLEQQIARAQAYARAEEIHNPRRRNPEQISVPTNSTDDVVMLQATAASSPTTASSSDSPSSLPPTAAATAEDPAADPSTSSTNAAAAAADPMPSHPFRDPTWEASERSYMTLAVSNLNTLTRSYNLMAPELAKKPYFSLERELRSCFADVAPQLAGEIRLRATGPGRSLVDHPLWGKGSVGGQGGRGRGMGMGGFGGLFGGGKEGGLRAVESRAKYYGFREFWRDLWRKG